MPKLTEKQRAYIVYQTVRARISSGYERLQDFDLNAFQLLSMDRLREWIETEMPEGLAQDLLEHCEPLTPWADLEAKEGDR